MMFGRRPFLAFLDHVESKRGNSSATRNCRLAAIRSFVQHLLRHDVTRADQYGRILAISNKRKPIRAARYLEPEAARAIITAIDLQAPQGTRDRACCSFSTIPERESVKPWLFALANSAWTGPQHVRLHGKGGKERLCPLWPETAVALRPMASAVSTDEPIFRNARGAPLTRDGAAYVIGKYARRAAGKMPDFGNRRVTPHAFRHGCAVALLQAGVGLTVIRDYLVTPRWLRPAVISPRI